MTFVNVLEEYPTKIPFTAFPAAFQNVLFINATQIK